MPDVVVAKDPMTSETLISGQGELELEIVRQKLLSKFGADAVFKDPKIAYRESIRKTIQVQGSHKKQSGGHGQFGDVWIEFSPADPGVEFEFVDAVVGGAVPRNFIPSVEKGLRENLCKGVLAGFPMMGLRAKLYDGTPWIPRKWPSRPQRASRISSASTLRPSCWSPSCMWKSACPMSTWATSWAI